MLSCLHIYACPVFLLVVLNFLPQPLSCLVYSKHPCFSGASCTICVVQMSSFSPLLSGHPLCFQLLVISICSLPFINQFMYFNMVSSFFLFWVLSVAFLVIFFHYRTGLSILVPSLQQILSNLLDFDFFMLLYTHYCYRFSSYPCIKI